VVGLLNSSKPHSLVATVLPEEFIWDEYHKNGAKKAEACLQANIIEYLCKNVEGFRRRYGNAYRNLIGSCSSKIMNNSADCQACKKHPKIMTIA
jgi:hypothetical protein